MPTVNMPALAVLSLITFFAMIILCLICFSLIKSINKQAKRLIILENNQTENLTRFVGIHDQLIKAFTEITELNKTLKKALQFIVDIQVKMIPEVKVNTPFSDEPTKFAKLMQDAWKRNEEKRKERLSKTPESEETIEISSQDLHKYFNIVGPSGGVIMLTEFGRIVTLCQAFIKEHSGCGFQCEGAQEMSKEIVKETENVSKRFGIKNIYPMARVNPVSGDSIITFSVPKPIAGIYSKEEIKNIMALSFKMPVNPLQN